MDSASATDGTLTTNPSQSSGGSSGDAPTTQKGPDDTDDTDDQSDQQTAKTSMSGFTDTEKPPGDDCFYIDEDGEEEECEAEDEEEYETEEDLEEEEEEEEEVLTEEQERARQEELERFLVKQLLQERKNSLVQEYEKESQNFNRLRAKNYILGIKIRSFIEQRQDVVNGYMQRERDDQKRRQADDMLKKRQLMESCANANRGAKKPKKKGKGKRKRAASRSTKHTRFSDVDLPTSSDNLGAELPERKFGSIHAQVPDVSLNELKKKNVFNFHLFVADSIKKVQRKEACKRLKYLRQRINRKTIPFTYHRQEFLKDVIQPKKKTSELFGNLNLNKHLSTAELKEAVLDTASIMEPVSFQGKPEEPKVPVAKKVDKKKRLEALGLALIRSKSRMALDSVIENQVKLQSNKTIWKNLHLFKFEFAGARANQDQLTGKIREDLVRMLEQRQICTTQLKWPLEVKGLEREGKNPYGRVALTYKRLSANEKNQPNKAYRRVLTNMAFLRTKLGRMLRKHRKNMKQLEEERERLRNGVQLIFDEIVEGLQIMASLSGITDFEKREAKHENEVFVQELKKMYTEFFMERLVKLYKSISSCEFALQQLAISEAKGEGAELHEFKEILRSREKLKAEHKNVEIATMKYQKRADSIFGTVQKSGRKLDNARFAIKKMDNELGAIKECLVTMIQAMYKTQKVLRKENQNELKLISRSGILSSPTLMGDFTNVGYKVEDLKSWKIELARAYNRSVREMEKITYPSRFHRYKLRS